MDNIEELSKPVAEVNSKYGDPEAFGEREINVLADIQKMPYQTKFYSQEYVDSLIAQLEAAQKEITDWRSVAEAAAQDDADWHKLVDSKNDVISHLASGIINLIARLEAAQLELIKPLPISELVHRLEGQTYEKWFSESDVKDLRERAEKAEAALSAANEKLSKAVVLPDDGLEDCINMWPDNWRNDFDTGYNFGIWRCEQNIKAAGFTVEGE